MGSRSLSKGPFVEKKLLDKINKANTDNSYEVIKTWSRRSTILPNFVGRTISIYSGKQFVSVNIVEEMVGKKLGEFVATRRFNSHSSNKKQS